MPKAKLFIAAVVNEFGDVLNVLSSCSGRPQGDWASFIDTDRNKAIEAAIKAREKWHNKGFGPYRILVGRLVAEITVPTQYEEVAL